MIKNDDDNLVLVDSINSVDELNAKFYGRFPYPWQAIRFDYLEDQSFETAMLNQDIGVWTHDRIPPEPRIWVAGCGTNLAVITALKFPRARVIGSDLSPTSLEICAETAKQLGVSNLELKQESINQVAYREEFDYIINTGVIHHNADPQATLARIYAALKPDGVLELMVYNRFQWAIPAAFQKAIRLLGSNGPAIDFDSDLVIAKTMIGELPQDTLIGIVGNYRDFSDAMLADELLQPVLHSYTVESLADLVASCGLEIILPCLNQLDKAEQKYSWNIEFQNPRLKEVYESLSDVNRWQVTNLLLRERAGWLWFYVQRTDSPYQRKSEKEICEDFLNTTFDRSGTVQRSLVRNADGSYRLLPRSISYPAPSANASVEKIVNAVDGHRTMKEIFQELGGDIALPVRLARIMLATSAFPYLKAVTTDKH